MDSSLGGKRWGPVVLRAEGECSSPAARQSSSPTFLLSILIRPSMDWMVATCCGEDCLLCPVYGFQCQSYRNAIYIETPVSYRNGNLEIMLPAMWIPCGPVKLTHINCRSHFTFVLHVVCLHTLICELSLVGLHCGLQMIAGGIESEQALAQVQKTKLPTYYRHPQVCKKQVAFNEPLMLAFLPSGLVFQGAHSSLLLKYSICNSWISKWVNKRQAHGRKIPYQLLCRHNAL